MDRLDQLERDLRALHERGRAETLAHHRRFNPFAEDLFDWRERGRAWLGEDRGVTVYNSATLIGDVTIGEGTWVGPFTMLDGSGGKLSIGHHCSIATGVQLVTHDTVRWALSGGEASYQGAPIAIGDCCFIGTHAVVVRGKSVGAHCLVGAGAVVTGDVPDHCIVAGVPARVIGHVEVRDGKVQLEYSD